MLTILRIGGPADMRGSYGFNGPQIRQIAADLLANIRLYALNVGRSVEIYDTAIQEAEQRLRNRLASDPHAIAARYDRRVPRVMVSRRSK